MADTHHVLTSEQVLRRYAVCAGSPEEALERATAALAAGEAPGHLVFEGRTSEEALDAEPAR